jgi:putative ABC transport system permease protein
MARGGGVGSLVSVDRLGPTDVLLGADLARRLNKMAGDRVTLRGRSWHVARVLPPLGSADDLALFMPLVTLQQMSGAGHSVNEIRLYARQASATAEVAALLRTGHPELSVVRNTDRGDVAERQTAATLRQHRTVIYGLTALAVAIGLMTAAYINAGERRGEMAMLVATGGTATAVLLTLVARAAIVGVVGAVGGYALGAGIAIGQDTSATMSMAWSWVQPVAVVIAAAALSTAAVIPVSIHATYQDHVRALQE